DSQSNEGGRRVYRRPETRPHRNQVRPPRLPRGAEPRHRGDGQHRPHPLHGQRRADRGLQPARGRQHRACGEGRGDRHPGRSWLQMIDPVLREAETKMTKSVEHLSNELTSIRTGRANAALIDRVMVPYYGTPTPLNQLAQISAPEPRLLVVQVYDKSQIGVVEKALGTGEQGLNPASDGQVIRVPIPPLTEERRKEYVR